MVAALRIAASASVLFINVGSRTHPIHAARVELDATAAGIVSAVVHVYRDDFPAGIKRPDVDAVFDRTLVVTDAQGKRIALRTTALIEEGDRLRITLAGTAPARLNGGQIALTLLQERFPDQVNVVDARIQGKRAQLVFLRGDGPQLLP